MIFATVGTQLPFPRFLRALDDIAGRHALSVTAQTSDQSASLRHVRVHAHIPPAQYDQLIDQADVVVGHAGIGTILSARRAGKPIVVFPRKASLGEHRNDHQLATAAALSRHPGIYIAYDADELESHLVSGTLSAGSGTVSHAQSALVQFLRDYVSR